MSTRTMIDRRTGMYWAVTWLYWAVMDCSGLFCTVLGCTGLSRAGGPGDPGRPGGQGSQDDQPR